MRTRASTFVLQSASLFIVFVLAKTMMVAGGTLPLSPWSLIALIWQDVAVALAIAALGSVFRRTWFGWTLYGAAVIYAAVNVPIARLLSSVLTWPMIRATGNALSDSIAHDVNAANVISILIVVAAGTSVPLLLRRCAIKSRWQLATLLMAALVVAFGPLATRYVDTAGQHRNSIAALLASTVPRIRSASSLEFHSQLLRTSEPDATQANHDQNLRWLRGTARGRNVVLIALESTGAQYLKLFGASADPMPNLTQLAGESVLFENAYAVYPESIKGLFSVLCSIHPAIDTSTKAYRKLACDALPAELACAGYSTALFHSGRFMYLGMQDIIQNRGYQTLEDAGAISGNFNSSFGVDEPSTVRRILEWLDHQNQTSDNPFFLTYQPIAGHHPYDSPDGGPFPEYDEQGRYLNALHYADSALAQLIEGIKARGLFEKTLFVIYGDHGEAFGQHEGNFGHTLHVYEENIHVPLLIVAPGLVREQRRIARPVSLVDIAPTLLEMLGKPIPTSFEGVSLLTRSRGAVLFFTDYSLALLGLRDGQWKLIYELESDRSKLFDLQSDPTEKNDLSEKHAEKVISYRQYVRDWSAAQRAKLLHRR